MSQIPNKKNTRKVLPERLRLLREKKELLQKELAVSMKITSASISSWEQGKTIPSQKNLQLLAQKLGTTTDYLTGKTDSPLWEMAPDKDGHSIPVKVLGLTGDFKNDIGYLVNSLETKYLGDLYRLLLTTRYFDSNEWQSLVLLASTLYACRDSESLKVYHPLTSFPMMKSYFSETIAFINQLKNNVSFKAKTNSNITSLLINFEYCLKEDYKSCDNHFQSTESIKHFFSHTNQNIDSIKNELSQFSFCPDSKYNREFQEDYIKRLTEAYENDLQNMVRSLSKL